MKNASFLFFSPFLSIKLLNTFYKPTVTNKIVRKNKRKETYNKNGQHKTQCLSQSSANNGNYNNCIYKKIVS